MDNNNEATTPQPAPAQPPVAQPVTPQPVQPTTAQPVAPQPAMAQPIAETQTNPTTVNAGAGMGGEGSTTKNSHVGAIVGIAAGVVVLGGAGVFAYTNSQPENIALGAFSNFINAKTLSLSGTVSAIRENSYTDNSTKVSLTFKNDTQNLNNSTTASASVDMAGLNETLNVDLGSVFVEDGTLYIKVDKLKDAFNSVAKAMMNNYSTDTTNCSNATDAENCLPSTSGTIYDDLIGEIDGKWWKINVEEVTDALYNKGLITNTDKNHIGGGWSCTFDYMKKLSEKRDDFTKVYKENPFLKIKAHEGDLANSAGISLDEFKKSGSLYDLSFDSGKMASFINSAVDKMDTESYTSCLVEKEIISEKQKSKTKDVKQEDIDKALENIPSIVVATNGFFSHKLTGVYVDYAKDDAKLTTALTFNYPGSLSISAPSDAKPIMDLYDTFMETMNKSYSSSTYYLL